MSTLAFPTMTAPTAGAAYCGEVITWNRAWKSGQSFQLPAIRAALSQAGLDPKLAKDISGPDAFRRACRTLSDQGIIKCLVDRKDTVAFLYDFQATVQGGKTSNVAVMAECVLEKATGNIQSTDPAMTAKVQAAIQAVVDSRTVSDVSRLLASIVTNSCGGVLFSFADGVHFLPWSEHHLADQLETFVTALGGNLRRLPVPDLAPAGSGATVPPPVVTQIVQDSLHQLVDEYETKVRELHSDSSTRAVNAAKRAVEEAYDAVSRHRQFLEGQSAILEDHLALCEHLIREAKSKAPPAGEDEGSGFLFSF